MSSKAAAVRSRTFCCCIPVRAGVIVRPLDPKVERALMYLCQQLLSILGFLGGGAIAGVGIINIKKSGM